jgi:hypothetical protein
VTPNVAPIASEALVELGESLPEVQVRLTETEALLLGTKSLLTTKTPTADSKHVCAAISFPEADT